jgi:eukaryotic-like serine/threonine-protein kinase
VITVMSPEPTSRHLPPTPRALASSGERSLHAGAELAPGTLLAGKYRIKAVLGRGGFATVYDAEQVALSRDVALKVLHRTDVTPSALLERFAREVRISALVRHPNVLEVYDAGVLEDGSPFLAMEKVSGPTLHEWLCRMQRLSLEQTLELAAQLLAALVAIGGQAIIHRDIKPENLMLAPGAGPMPQLKLLDFGIALVREERIAGRLTAQGVLIGTPQYMAPEQLRCEITDARVDVYAAGVVMYQALTGALPHDAADLGALTLCVLDGKLRPLRALRPDCPRRLAKLVERALAPQPARRFPDAASMLAALEVCRAEHASRGRPLREGWQSHLPRSRVGRVGLLVCALAAAGGVQAGVAAGVRRALNGTPQVDAVAAQPGAAPPQARATGEPAAAGAASSSAVAAPTLAAAAKYASAPELTAARTTVLGTQVGPDHGKPQLVPALPVTAERAERKPAPRPGSASAEPAQRARELMNRGLSLYLHANLDAAYAAYRQASQLAPQDPAAFRALGLLGSQLGRNEEARRALARYLELAPDAADAALIRARMLTMIGESAGTPDRPTLVSERR